MKSGNDSDLRTMTSLALLLSSFIFINYAYAASSQDIDIQTENAIQVFSNRVHGGGEFLKQAKGVLIFPEIVKTGVGPGGEYADGELRINNRVADHFTIFGVSLGLQLDGHLRSIILMFMDDRSLNIFLAGYGWEINVDGSVTKVKSGETGSPVSGLIKAPVIGFLISDDDQIFRLTNAAKGFDVKPAQDSLSGFKNAEL